MKTKNRLEKRIRRLMHMEYGQYGYGIVEREWIGRLGIYEKVISIRVMPDNPSRRNRKIDRPIARWSSLHDMVTVIKNLRYLEN